MNLLSIVMYACLLLPFQVKAMEFKNQLLHSNTNYQEFTSKTNSSYEKPAPKRTTNSLIRVAQTTKGNK